MDGVDELVLGAAAVKGPVGEEDSGAAHAECAVEYELLRIIAHVAILGDVFCAHY